MAAFSKDVGALLGLSNDCKGPRLLVMNHNDYLQLQAFRHAWY